MSGHSKWHNIQMKKGKTDAARAKIFTKIGREIAIAVKAGGPDPALNAKLRDVVSKAKANNMPNDNIQRSIKKAAGEGQGENYIPGVYVKFGNLARFRRIDPVDSEHPRVTDGDYLLVLPSGTAGSVSQVRLYDEIIVSGQKLYDGKLL